MPLQISTATTIVAAPPRVVFLFAGTSVDLGPPASGAKPLADPGEGDLKAPFPTAPPPHTKKRSNDSRSRYMESRKLIKENKETLILYDLKTEKITPEAR